MAMRGFFGFGAPANDGICIQCHAKPRYVDPKTGQQHEFCGRSCAQAFQAANPAPHAAYGQPVYGAPGGAGKPGKPPKNGAKNPPPNANAVPGMIPAMPPGAGAMNGAGPVVVYVSEPARFDLKDLPLVSLWRQQGIDVIVTPDPASVLVLEKLVDILFVTAPASIFNNVRASLGKSFTPDFVPEQSATMIIDQRMGAHNANAAPAAGPAPKGQPPNTIWFYNRGEPFYEFTNFAVPYPIRLDGTEWPSSEHYFQAQKYYSPSLQEEIRNAATPRDAFELTRDPRFQAKQRMDWDTHKMEAMEKALQAKFTQHAYLRQMLLDTGDQHLVEHSPYDAFWGDGPGPAHSGQNQLGIMLVKLRTTLRTKGANWYYPPEFMGGAAGAPDPAPKKKKPAGDRPLDREEKLARKKAKEVREAAAQANANAMQGQQPFQPNGLAQNQFGLPQNPGGMPVSPPMNPAQPPYAGAAYAPAPAAAGAYVGYPPMQGQPQYYPPQGAMPQNPPQGKPPGGSPGPVAYAAPAQPVGIPAQPMGLPMQPPAPAQPGSQPQVLIQLPDGQVQHNNMGAGQRQPAAAAFPDSLLYPADMGVHVQAAVHAPLPEPSGHDQKEQNDLFK